ncbi:DNA independent RNA polymerase I transcription factor [Dimargaris verticillata]|uniref:DNA independent RNA polymerase I transcription factor n=1 Tax=Dimargaris verticillata TaxID=2761393 RepID=A0A9W8BA46_9FUNG|nr:DNA independent RNA polymerase I transcription factor [Dimargaris verticillata]
MAPSFPQAVLDSDHTNPTPTSSAQKGRSVRFAIDVEADDNAPFESVEQGLTNLPQDLGRRPQLPMQSSDLGTLSLSSSDSEDEENSATGTDNGPGLGLSGAKASERRLNRVTMMTRYVANAVQEFKAGNRRPYEEILHELTNSANRANQSQSLTSQLVASGRSNAAMDNNAAANLKAAARKGLTAHQMLPWLYAFAQSITALDRRCYALVDAILSWQWIIQPQDALVSTYIQFLGNLVSAQPCYVVPTMTMLVRHLAYPNSYAVVTANGDSAAAGRITQDAVFDRAHLALQRILTLIPTSQSQLHSLLVQMFPFKRENVARHRSYVANLLRIMDYAPVLRHQLMALIVDRLLHIDVEIQVEIDELDEEEEGEGERSVQERIFGTAAEQADEAAGVSSGVFAGGINILVGDDIVDDDDDLAPTAPETPQILNIREMIAKLDAMLLQVFEYLARFHPSRDPVDAPQHQEHNATLRAEFLQIFMDIFETSLLPTFKSRYTQFILFYLCTLDPLYPDLFLGALMTKLRDTLPVEAVNDSSFSGSGSTGQSDVMRIAVASYASSFVARARFVQTPMVRLVVGMLVQWACAYLDHYEQYLTNAMLQRSLNALSANQHARGPLSNHKGSLTPNTTAAGTGQSTPGTASGLARSSSMPTFAVATEVSQSAVNPRRHAVFYSVVQAIMYLFCFRWRDLQTVTPALDGPSTTSSTLGSSGLLVGQPEWCAELNGVQRIITSSLNPLRVCSSVVVKQFASMSQQLGFTYCYSIIRTNRVMDQIQGSTLAETESSVATPTALGALDSAKTALQRRAHTAATYADIVRTQSRMLQRELETFFPFDPYQLPQSAAFIQPIYQEWESPLPAEGDLLDSESESSSESGESESDSDESILSASDDEADDGSKENDILVEFHHDGNGPQPDMPLQLPQFQAPLHPAPIAISSLAQPVVGSMDSDRELPAGTPMSCTPAELL